MIQYEIWDVEAFQQLAVFADARSATEWVFQTFARSDGPVGIDRLSLIAAGEESEEVIADGQELLDLAIRQHNLAGIS